MSKKFTVVMYVKENMPRVLTRIIVAPSMASAKDYARALAEDLNARVKNITPVC